MTTRSFVRPLSASLLIIFTASAALAVEPADDHPLSGPKVEDRSAPGVNPTLDGNQRDPRTRGGERNRPALFIGAVMSLDAPETPENLRLSDDQRGKAKAIGKEYADALRAFRDEHREEIDKLRDGAERPRRSDRDDADRRRPVKPEDLTPEQQEKAAQLRTLMEQAPKAEPYQARLWALLSPEQQTLATKRLDELKSQSPEERRERFRDGARERRRDRGPDDAPPPPPGDDREPRADSRAPRAERFGLENDRRPPPPPRGDDRPVTFDDLRARLDRLPPEQRQRALRRIMESLDRLEDRAPRDRPPPPMREVEVP